MNDKKHLKCLSQRTLHAPAADYRRFATFREATIPVIEYFIHANKLVSICGNKSEEDVWNDLKSLFTSKFIDQSWDWDHGHAK